MYIYSQMRMCTLVYVSCSVGYVYMHRLYIGLHVVKIALLGLQLHTLT